MIKLLKILCNIATAPFRGIALYLLMFAYAGIILLVLVVGCRYQADKLVERDPFSLGGKWLKGFKIKCGEDLDD